jgi:peptidoglycan/xylan/chitin deacetylase (PgdA/CDA1 family)
MDLAVLDLRGAGDLCIGVEEDQPRARRSLVECSYETAHRRQTTASVTVIVPPVPRPHARSALAAVALAAVAVAAAPGALAGANATAVSARPARYRIVGCRSQGTVAYLRGPGLREVAIGFDDGPAPDTGRFVAMLEREHVQATFFMIGEHVASAYRPLLLRELRDGDVLGDHTFTHADLVTAGGARSQLQRTIGVIRALTGYTPCVFRPPYGAYDPAVVQTARSLGLATVQWNVDPRDWALPGTRSIVSTVLAEVRPGSIILSHDGGGPRGQTLAAYPQIFRALRARGLRVVTIPELLGFRPVYRPCIRLCEGLGVPRKALPRDAIVERAP